MMTLVMRRTPSARVASLGVVRARLAVEAELGWLFREQPTEDYGIDAQIEVVDGEAVRGKLLALQIKSGLSLFREPAPGGWWFRPKADHVHYWTNHSLPVAVILYHPETGRCHWQLVNASTLVATSNGGWKLLVPEYQVLDKSALAALREAAEGDPVIVRIQDSGSRAKEFRVSKHRIDERDQSRESDPLNNSDGSHQPSRHASKPQEIGREVLAAQKAEEGISSLDITPSPRLLESLTQVVATPWICIAKIIDTAYDLTHDNCPEPTHLAVSITLPSPSSENSDELIIRDNGVGMDATALLAAARGSFSGVAGESGPGIGLFMMATRLGHRVTLRTSREGDSSWIELSYSLLELGMRDAFTARVCRVAKSCHAEHGTEIVIGDLRADLRASLAQQTKTVHERLGDCYSYLMREGKLAITLNGKPIRPRRPCTWDASRVVMFGDEPISAVQEINQILPTACVCRSCGFRQRQPTDACIACGSLDLDTQPRRIWGWLGVQRYLHRTDFGLDFLRNGRKILCRDKRLFDWAEQGDPFPEPEYPVELGQGRIVGEIHCDHLPVSFLKNAFDYDSADWQEVVRAIRGTAPLRTGLCSKLGYPRNDSPLGLLFRGFRRNDPGTRYLVPGDGERALHQKAQEWAARFHDGDPDFQTDQIWYDAALAHDEIRKKR